MGFSWPGRCAGAVRTALALKRLRCAKCQTGVWEPEWHVAPPSAANIRAAPAFFFWAFRFWMAQITKQPNQ
jgi:hypothetical protein